MLTDIEQRYELALIIEYQAKQNLLRTDMNDESYVLLTELYQKAVELTDLCAVEWHNIKYSDKNEHNL